MTWYDIRRFISKKKLSLLFLLNCLCEPNSEREGGNGNGIFRNYFGFKNMKSILKKYSVINGTGPMNKRVGASECEMRGPIRPIGSLIVGNHVRTMPVRPMVPPENVGRWLDVASTLDRANRRKRRDVHSGGARRMVVGRVSFNSVRRETRGKQRTPRGKTDVFPFSLLLLLFP